MGKAEASHVSSDGTVMSTAVGDTVHEVAHQHQAVSITSDPPLEEFSTGDPEQFREAALKWDECVLTMARRFVYSQANTVAFRSDHRKPFLPGVDCREPFGQERRARRR